MASIKSNIKANSRLHFHKNKQIVKCKCSQAQIIVTVLIILIGIAAVALVGTFIFRVVGENISDADAQSSIGQLKIVPEVTYFNSTSSSLLISIERGYGEFNLTGINVVIADDGNSESFDIVLGVTNVEMSSGSPDIQIPAPGERKTYLIKSTGFKSVGSISIFPILTKGKLGKLSDSQSISSAGFTADSNAVDGNQDGDFDDPEDDFDGDGINNTDDTTPYGNCSASCSSEGYECGTHSICDFTISCGTCSGDDICSNGKCVKDCSGYSGCDNFFCGTESVCSQDCGACSSCPDLEKIELYLDNVYNYDDYEITLTSISSGVEKAYFEVKKPDDSVESFMIDYRDHFFEVAIGKLEILNDGDISIAPSSAELKVCFGECGTNEECDALYPGENRQCSNLFCVECSDSSDCGVDELCIENSCLTCAESPIGTVCGGGMKFDNDTVFLVEPPNYPYLSSPGEGNSYCESLNEEGYDDWIFVRDGQELDVLHDFAVTSYIYEGICCSSTGACQYFDRTNDYFSSWGGRRCVICIRDI